MYSTEMVKIKNWVLCPCWRLWYFFCIALTLGFVIMISRSWDSRYVMWCNLIYKEASFVTVFHIVLHFLKISLFNPFLWELIFNFKFSLFSFTLEIKIFPRIGFWDKKLKKMMDVSCNLRAVKCLNRIDLVA